MSPCSRNHRGYECLAGRENGSDRAITTAGFEDALEIGRQNRPELYTLHPIKTAPLIPEAFRYGITERILQNGAVLTPLDKEEVLAALEKIHDAYIQAVAVCLLHSYVNPIHEQVIGALAREKGFTVSLSCEALPEFREFERASTVAVNAALRPVMGGYLERLEAGAEHY